MSKAINTVFLMQSYASLKRNNRGNFFADIFLTDYINTLKNHSTTIERPKLTDESNTHDQSKSPINIDRVVAKCSPIALFGALFFGSGFLGTSAWNIINTHHLALTGTTATSCVLGWNIINIVIGIATIGLLIKHKLYREAAGLAINVSILTACSTIDVLSLPAVSVIKGFSALIIGAAANFAFTGLLLINTIIDIGHMIGAHRRAKAMQSPVIEINYQMKKITDKYKGQSKQQTKMSIEDQESLSQLAINKYTATHFQSYQCALARYHRDKAIVSGLATFSVATISTSTLLISLGLIGGISISTMTMGVAPALLASTFLLFTLFRYFYKKPKPTPAEALNEPTFKKVDIQASDCEPVKANSGEASMRLFTPSNQRTDVTDTPKPESASTSRPPMATSG